MGIEQNLTGKFDARCDGCDAFKELGLHRAQTAQVQLRFFGWKRSDYITAAKHYVWLCPKCKDKDVSQQLST